MISTTIKQMGEQSVTDWLGDDGAERTATWPVFTATFVHVATGEIVGHRSWTLRERSAFTTLEEIEADASAAAQQLADSLSALEAAGFDSATLDGVDQGEFWRVSTERSL